MKRERNIGFGDENFSTSVKDSVESYLQGFGRDDPQFLYRHLIEGVESPLLKVIMKKANYNQSRAARCLGINRQTLHKKLKRHGILFE